MMAQSKKRPDDEAPGAPEWMVTFSDCMTLLLTFFVLLLSFASFDPEIFEKFDSIFDDAWPSIAVGAAAPKDSLLPSEQIDSSKNTKEGSEKPTLEPGKEDGLKQESESVDFRSRKIFLIGSDKVFLGSSMIISPQGGKALAAAANYLKQVPGRIVVSENADESPIRSGTPSLRDGQEQTGLERAWAVTEFLTAGQGLDRSRFSISAETTLPPSTRNGYKTGISGTQSARLLEIILLEWGIYN